MDSRQVSLGAWRRGKRLGGSWIRTGLAEGEEKGQHQFQSNFGCRMEHSQGRLPGWRRGRKLGRQGGQEGSRGWRSLRYWFKEQREWVSQSPHPHPRNPPSEGAAQCGRGCHSWNLRNSPCAPLPRQLCSVCPSLFLSLYQSLFYLSLNLFLLHFYVLFYSNSLSFSFSPCLSPPVSPSLSHSAAAFSLSSSWSYLDSPRFVPAGPLVGAGAQGSGTEGWGRARHLVPLPGWGRLRKSRQTPESGTQPRPSPPSHLISSWHLPLLPLWKSHQCPPASPRLVPMEPLFGPAP